MKTVLFVLFLFLSSCAPVNNESNETEQLVIKEVESYGDSLSLYQKAYAADSAIPENKLLVLIPTNRKEYQAFYKLTVDQTGYHFTDYLYTSLFEQAKSNNQCLDALLNFSNLVDGEMAESYFYDSYGLFKEDSKQLCLHYNKEKYPRLSDLYEHFCNGKELIDAEFYE